MPYLVVAAIAVIDDQQDHDEAWFSDIGICLTQVKCPPEPAYDTFRT